MERSWSSVRSSYVILGQKLGQSPFQSHSRWEKNFLIKIYLSKVSSLMMRMIFLSIPQANRVAT